MQISEQIYEDFKRGHIDSLYREGYASMKAFAARYLTDNYAMMAEDCVQDAIEQAFLTRTSFISPSQIKAFLYTCIRNNCVSLLRKTTSRANYISQQEISEEEHLSAAIIEQETLDLLYQAVNALPDKYRQVFELGYEQGLSYKEAAQQLGITIDGYNKRKSKMISLLRERFKGNEQLLLLLTII